MQEGSGTEKMAVKRTSKCGSLGERVAKLQDDGSIVLARDGVAGPRLPQAEERREGDRRASVGGEAPMGGDWRMGVLVAISHEGCKSISLSRFFVLRKSGCGYAVPRETDYAVG